MKLIMIIQFTCTEELESEIRNILSSDSLEATKDLIEATLQAAYWDSLQLTLSELRNNDKWWIHDYSNRKFETPFGEIMLKICRIKNLKTGQTERILPEFTIPYSRLTSMEIPLVLSPDQQVDDYTSLTPNVDKRRLIYLKKTIEQQCSFKESNISSSPFKNRVQFTFSLSLFDQPQSVEIESLWKGRRVLIINQKHLF